MAVRGLWALAGSLLELRSVAGPPRDVTEHVQTLGLT